MFLHLPIEITTRHNNLIPDCNVTNPLIFVDIFVSNVFQN